MPACMALSTSSFQSLAPLVWPYLGSFHMKICYPVFTCYGWVGFSVWFDWEEADKWQPPQLVDHCVVSSEQEDPECSSSYSDKDWLEVTGPRWAFFLRVAPWPPHISWMAESPCWTKIKYTPPPDECIWALVLPTQSRSPLCVWHAWGIRCDHKPSDPQCWSHVSLLPLSSCNMSW